MRATNFLCAEAAADSLCHSSSLHTPSGVNKIESINQSRNMGRSYIKSRAGSIARNALLGMLVGNSGRGF
jgi:hypothetical protein